jgi:hypothetical protein
MMVVVMDFAGRYESFDRILVAGGMTLEFTAIADALIRLDMRAGRNFLQLHLHRFATCCAFESQKTGWFVGHVDFPLKNVM